MFLISPYSIEGTFRPDAGHTHFYYTRLMANSDIVGYNSDRLLKEAEVSLFSIGRIIEAQPTIPFHFVREWEEAGGWYTKKARAALEWSTMGTGFSFSGTPHYKELHHDVHNINSSTNRKTTTKEKGKRARYVYIYVRESCLLHMRNDCLAYIETISSAGKTSEKWNERKWRGRTIIEIKETMVEKETKWNRI